MMRDHCHACTMMRAGVKTRIALHHTCGLRPGEFPSDMREQMRIDADIKFEKLKRDANAAREVPDNKR